MKSLARQMLVAIYGQGHTDYGGPVLDWSLDPSLSNTSKFKVVFIAPESRAWLYEKETRKNPCSVQLCLLLDILTLTLQLESQNKEMHKNAQRYDFS